jgi:hypothetical protein
MSKPFPGSTLRIGRPADPATVEVVQQRLVSLNLLKPPVSKAYDAATAAAVRGFQTINSDARGEPLGVDGEVGPITWRALFGPPSAVTFSDPINPDLARAVIALAEREAAAGVRETASNRGPRVDEYVDFVGLDPAGSHDWCACFLQFIFHEAAMSLGVASPMPFRSGGLREPGAQRLWKKAEELGTPRLTRSEALANPSDLRPGAVFVLNRGGGKGHVGLLIGWQNDRLLTIEGNTNPDSGGPSNGVYRRTNRRISQVDFGFILYC